MKMFSRNKALRVVVFIGLIYVLILFTFLILQEFISFSDVFRIIWVVIGMILALITTILYSNELTRRESRKRRK